jgi:hypothetical protein
MLKDRLANQSNTHTRPVAAAVHANTIRMVSIMLVTRTFFGAVEAIAGKELAG